MKMIESIGSDVVNLFGIILAIGVAWIVLRFILRLAQRVFQIGCLAIIVIGGILILLQYIR
jgi:hypothetical protein